LQVTIPKALADRYGIEPGQEVEWLPAGDAIRVVPEGRPDAVGDTRRRLAIFDRASARQRGRQGTRGPLAEPSSRGWSRNELYERARAR
jgi:bifunctional DNA-binding transcriptional regulator/antitoxin component of YhaV-PrlF toxin-antitoxin module